MEGLDLAYCPPCILCWPIWVGLLVVYVVVCGLAMFGFEWAIEYRNKINKVLREGISKIKEWFTRWSNE